MAKFLHLAVLYCIIGLTFTHPDLLSFFGFANPAASHHPANICSNPTTAPSYLSETLVLIGKLQANSTYNSVLQLQWANVVSYLQNTTNQALLSTNCTTFEANLAAAKSADKATECTRQKIASQIQKEFQQVARNTTGINESDDSDSCEEEEHRF